MSAIFCAFVGKAYGGPPSSLFSIYSKPAETPVSPAFLVPNEGYPENSQPVLNKVPIGTAYLTVGSLRGWMGYGLCKNCTSLVLIDRQDGIVFFNHILRLLIKISRGDTVTERTMAFGLNDTFFQPPRNQ